jgi:hypothetical protein
MLEGFDFGSLSTAKYLTGKLAILKKYNAINVPADYFEEAMERVCTRFFNTPLDAVLHPLSSAVKEVVKEQQAAAAEASSVDTQQLTAQEWFERGYKSIDNDEKFHCYTEAIHLKPD